ATPYQSSGSTFEISNPPPVPISNLGDGIDFVNIEDTQRTVNINAPSGIGLGGVDTIHINRSNDFGSENLDTLPLSGSGSAAAADSAPVSAPKLSAEDEAIEKAKLLNKLRRLQSKGIEGVKMNMTNSLEEIKAEYSRLSDSAGLEKSIKFQRQLLVTCVTGLETLNQKFNPIDVNLDGWSESINENQEDYDEIFEELYDKYKTKVKTEPEIKLLFSLGMSAAMCHVTNTFFRSSKMPGMDEVLKRNPDLARQVTQEALRQSGAPGFANFMGMGFDRRPSQSAEPVGMPAFSGNSGPAGGGWTPEPEEQPVQTARREMRGPSGVEDILKAFEAEDRGDTNAPSFIPPTRPDLDRDDQSVYTSTTLNGSEATARRAGRGGARKPKAQPAGASISLVV
ncbi:MAG: hypothetical protein EBS38_08375, partial [Actinobacteria bacterium]|nr:hypothetical protein [Actinomycetota bacterium]